MARGFHTEGHTFSTPDKGMILPALYRWRRGNPEGAGHLPKVTVNVGQRENQWGLLL